MPTLRELFERHNEPTSCYSIWVYDLLEALVNAVEPRDTELVKAKAELASAYENFKATTLKVREEVVEARAEIKRLRPLAELGELVRGMRFDSRLSRSETAYCSEYWRDDAWWKDGSWYADPAEALRAIQEEEDA